MSDLKVDIRPIEKLFLENLLGGPEVIGKERFAKLFEGSDLKFNLKTGNLETLINGKLQVQTLQKEGDFLRQLKAADKNGDKQIDLGEIRAFLEKTLGASAAAKINPELALKQINGLVQKRYAVVMKNVQRFEGELHWEALLASLETYNTGLKEDDLRHATSVLPLNGLTKSGLSTLAFITYNLLYRPFAKITGMKNKPEKSWFYGDTVVARRAEKNFLGRKAAIAEFQAAIAAGLAKGEAWAFNGNLDEALKKMKPESRAVLENYLAVGKIQKVLEIQDGAKKFEAMKKLALDERPSFLGYGGGNVAGFKTGDIFNYTGRHNNIYFSRSVQSYLTTKFPLEGRAKGQNPLRVELLKTRKDMLGDGGGFTNLFTVGTSNLLCGAGYLLTLGNRVGKTCTPTPYRRWGDEARMDAVGRTLNAGLFIYGSGRFLKAWSEAWGLKRLSGIREVGRVWKENVSPRSHFATKALENARIAEQKRIDATGDTPAWAQGAPNRLLSKVKQTLFGKLPPVEEVLNPTQLRLFKSGTQRVSGFGKILTNGVIRLYVTQNADKAMESRYNKYGTNHELNLDPPIVLTKPDPLLNPVPKVSSPQRIRIIRTAPTAPKSSPIPTPNFKLTPPKSIR